MPQLSGPIWVQRFPTSRSTADLTRELRLPSMTSSARCMPAAQASRLRRHCDRPNAPT